MVFYAGNIGRGKPAGLLHRNIIFPSSRPPTPARSSGAAVRRPRRCHALFHGAASRSLSAVPKRQETSPAPLHLAVPTADLQPCCKESDSPSRSNASPVEPAVSPDPVHRLHQQLGCTQRSACDLSSVDSNHRPPPIRSKDTC